MKDLLERFEKECIDYIDDTDKGKLYRCNTSLYGELDIHVEPTNEVSNVPMGNVDSFLLDCPSFTQEAREVIVELIPEFYQRFSFEADTLTIHMNGYNLVITEIEDTNKTV